MDRIFEFLLVIALLIFVHICIVGIQVINESLSNYGIRNEKAEREEYGKKFYFKICIIFFHFCFFS